MMFSVFSIHLQGTSIRVQGGGIIHAIHVVIESDNLVVDDLGRVVGDIHDLPCETGNGVDGTTASGKTSLNFLHDG